MNTSDYYLSIKKQADVVWDASFKSDNHAKLSCTHHMILELGEWIDILQYRPESKILKTALKELQLSIATLNLGFYSKAFTGLRYFFERTLVAILFSGQEVQLRLWERGGRDTYWSEVMDENNGILSLNFTRAFFPELKDEIAHFRAITKKVYRECSEFVHGNNSVIQSLPETLEFNQELFEIWHQKASVMIRVILFVLNLRFLKYLSIDDLKKTESINTEYFNNILNIRELY